MSRVFITGMGVVSPNGVGVPDYWNNCKNGIVGIRKIDFLDLSGVKTKIAGVIPNRDHLEFEHTQYMPLYDHFSVFSKVAADEALSNADIHLPLYPDRDHTAVFLGVAMGGMYSLEKCYIDFLVEKSGKTFDEILAAMPNCAGNLLALEYQIRGPNVTINTACSSSTTAIGLAYFNMKHGMFDLCIAGGTEAPVTPTTLRHFEKLRITNTRFNGQPEYACRPFSADRSGTVLSEGAAILILESDTHLRRREIAPLCEIVGFGTCNDAGNMVKPTVEGLEKSMRYALDDAGIPPESIDYIQAHGTSTRHNDEAETEAIKRVYGKNAYNIPVSSVKSMIGHSLGASGALSTVLTVLSLQKGYLTPTVNLDVRDDACDLDYVPRKGRSADIQIAAIHSFGLGGNNSVLIVKSALY